MNSGNSKNSDAYKLLLNLLFKIKLKIIDKYVLPYEILTSTIHGKT